MCVQFLTENNIEALALGLNAHIPKTFETKAHIFPKLMSPVIIYRREKVEVVTMHYGLIPHFEINDPPKLILHNARFETLKEKPSFKRAYLETRCLIPIKSFFEYVGEKSPKKLIQFTPDNHETLLAAGIYALWRNPKTQKVTAHFSIITTEADPFILQQGHDRSPYFLNKNSAFIWINHPFKNHLELDHYLLENKSDIKWQN